MNVKNNNGTFVIKINGTLVGSVDYKPTAEQIRKDYNSGIFASA